MLNRIIPGFTCAIFGVHVLFGNLTQSDKPDTQQTYIPEKYERFSENWRWQFIEQASGRVIHCLEDAGDGSIWVGGNQTVWKFDGIHWYEFNQFPANTRIGWIKDILVTKNNSVYIRSQYGLYLLSDDRWVKLIELNNDDSVVEQMVEDPNGSIWSVSPDGIVQIKNNQVIIIGGFSNKYTNVWIDKNRNLWTVNELDSSIVQIPLKQTGLTSIENWRYHKINFREGLQNPAFYESSDGRMWVTDENPKNPAFVINPESSHIEEIDFLKYGSNNMVFSITETQDGVIWIGSLGKINKYQKGRCTVYSSFDRNIPQFHIYLTSDKDGVLWISSTISLLYRFDYSHDNWLVYEGLNYQCSENGTNWFISKEGKVIAHNQKTEKWTIHDHTIDHPVRIIPLRNQKILVAGSHENHAAISILKDNRWSRRSHPDFAGGINRHSVYESRNGAIFFGAEFNESLTPSCKGGLLVYKPDSSEFGYQTELLNDPQIPFRVVSITEDREGMIWFGGNELFSIDFETKQAQKYLSDISSSTFRVAANSSGIIWVSTWGDGVYKKSFDNEWRHFGIEEGLPSEFVSTLIPLKNGLCWAGTLMGVCLFDGNNRFTKVLDDNFRSNLGPSSIQVQNESYLWINQVSTRWYTEPGIPPESETIKNSVYRCIRYKMDKDPPDTFLTHTVDKFAAKETAHFTWSGTDAWGNTTAENLQFSYRLDNGKWSDFSNTTHISQTSDKPGEHLLEVRARDQSLNVDLTPASFIYIVTAPVWLQPWFLTTIAILVTMIIGLVVLLIHIKLRHVIELEKVKLHFFTNISHQLKTPLTVILGPLENLISKIENKDSLFQLHLAHKNAQHMLHLVEQLLDFRRLQAGKTDLELYDFNLVQFVHDTAKEIEPLALQKGINFSIQTPDYKCVCRFDPAKIRSIIENLLSNAIKYTDEKGSVLVQLETTSYSNNRPILAKIVIEDNGIGIPRSDLHKVFDPYYRIKRQDQHHSTGSGIGLSYTKELVSLFNGSIKIHSPLHSESTNRKGTRIVVLLELEASSDLCDNNPNESTSNTVESNDTPTILIVEDNADIRSFLKSQFMHDYRIVEAKDGEVGFQMAKSESPDLILADLMMPKMNGMEMTRLLKKETLTSHIPVIILTAKKSDYDHIESLKIGADDYLTKPIKIEILKTKIRNIFERIRERQKTFNTQLSVEPKEIVVSSADEAFLKKALNLMEMRMGDFEFDVPEFAACMNMGRTNLYRKMKAITGETPSSFIKLIRLKRAAQLLKTGEFNVNEVVEKVGFMDASYFSSCFKKQFSCSPKQFQMMENPSNEVADVQKKIGDTV